MTHEEFKEKLESLVVQYGERWINAETFTKDLNTLLATAGIMFKKKGLQIVVFPNKNRLAAALGYASHRELKEAYKEVSTVIAKTWGKHIWHKETK
jgi:hypothetical protein